MRAPECFREGSCLRFDTGMTKCRAANSIVELAYAGMRSFIRKAAASFFAARLAASTRPSCQSLPRAQLRRTRKTRLIDRDPSMEERHGDNFGPQLAFNRAHRFVDGAVSLFMRDISSCISANRANGNSIFVNVECPNV